MQQPCAICNQLGEPASPTRTVLGLRTGDLGLIARAITDFGAIGAQRHVLLPVCPEHAVDVYRGRIAGVEMAWRLLSAEGVVATAR